MIIAHLPASFQVLVSVQATKCAAQFGISLEVEN
jgi:hypothetical protein